MIEIRGFFTDWHEVSKEQARKYISDIMKRMTALKKSEQIEFVEEKRLRGITVKELLMTQDRELSKSGIMIAKLHEKIYKLGDKIE